MFSASYALARGKVDSLSRSVATDFGLSADLFDTIIFILLLIIMSVFSQHDDHIQT